jgi:penicillin-binding protein 2
MVTRYVLRLCVFGLLLAAGFVTLLWRLWVVQIEDHKRYLAQVPQAATVVQRVPGLRGEIKDRNGIPLATNRMSLEIELDLREINRLYKSRHKEVPKNLYVVTDKFGTPREQEEDDIFRMYAEEVAPQLDRLDLLIDINSDEMRRHYRTNRGVIPYTYRKEVSFDQIALVAEQSRFLDGVTVSKRPLRHYPFGAMLAHTLGYVKLTGDLYIPPEDTGKFDFYEGDDEGIAGVEKTMDALLRGRAGQRVYPKDEHGKIVYEELTDLRIEPIKGHDVILTIDARIQFIAEMALRDAGVGRGAAVVMDPGSGELLAMVSVPGFDPNRFIPEIDADAWKAYEEDETGAMLNRVISAYPPGSTFKIPVALAGCVAGVSARPFPCNGGMQFGDHFAKCWCLSKGFTHPTMGLSDGIMHSCNGFFYRYGIATGIKTIDAVCHWFGLGETTGVDLPAEDPGLIPHPRLLTSGATWTESETAYTSIGQGQVLASPLQMCNVAATVANGGTAYRPKLVHRTHDNAEDMDTAFPDRPRTTLTEKGAKPSSIELVREGMWKVVNGPKGTARGARSKGYETAAKTGTAQAWRKSLDDNKTWFIAFAPYDHPKFAVCVFVENGTSGGGTSAPIAVRILKQAMAVDSGTYSPPLRPLAEAKGHFDNLDKVVYADDPVDEALAQAGQDDDAVTESPPPRETMRRKKPDVAKPKLKSRANPEGSNVSRRARPPRPQAGSAEPVKRPPLLRRLFNRGTDP